MPINQNALQSKVDTMYGKNRNTYNPFLDKNGNVFNKYIDHQSLLDNPGVSDKTKQFISSATGLKPTASGSVDMTSGLYADDYIRKKSGGGNLTPGGGGSLNLSDAAKKYIGTPYVWGGESMDEGGMDCSGFVYNALKDAGVNASRTTAQGFRSYGNKVDASSIQPGDLVFYGSGGKATHIGIYIGDGKIVHSAGGSKNTKSNPGKGVSIANLNHRSDLLEVRRIDK